MTVDTTSPTAAKIMRMTPDGETGSQGLGVALSAWYMAASVTALKTNPLSPHSLPQAQATCQV
jgi:hypothetical protein